jgi:hypothetical protein
MSLTISDELQSLIPPLSPEEYDQLEKNILKDGCRELLCVWGPDEILLDGHHRYKICTQHGLRYGKDAIDLPDMDAAKAWVIANQLGRRNLSPEQASYYRGEQYNLQKRQGKRTDLTSDHNDTKSRNTAQVLAAQHHVSEPTIKRDGAYAAAVETLATVLGPEARQAVLTGHLQLPKQDVPLLASLVEKSPETAAQVTEALRGTAPADALRAILTAARCGICHRPLSNPASVSRGIGPICAGHDADSLASAQSAPVLVLEPEAPESDGTPASPLTERERAYFGPSTEKEPGSVAWCWATIALMQTRWKQKKLDEADFDALVKELEEYEAWKVVPPEQPYGTLGVLLQEELGLDRFFAAALAPDHPLHDELVLPSKVDNALYEALGQLETLETYYRTTPHLFALHGEGYLALTEACRRFAALVAPAEPPAPAPASELAPDPAPPRLRDQVGLQQAVWLMVQQLQPCTNAQVKEALGEQRPVTHLALQTLVKKGKIIKEGETYRTVDASN